MFTITITTHDQPEVLARCIPSLLLTNPKPRKFLVVDDHSTNHEAISWLHSLVGDEGRIVHFGGHAHIAAMCNLMWHECFSDPVDFGIWVHPDMAFPDPAWAQKLVDYARTHPDLGKVSAENTLAADSTEPIDGRDRPGHQGPYLITRRAYEAVTASDGSFMDEAFISLGGWDDWDLNQRLLRLGFGVTICGAARVFHEGAGARGPLQSSTEQQCRQNQILYFQKWGTWDPPV